MNITYNLTQDYLTPNQYSRPQISLTAVKGLVIHWTANPLTDGKANRNYFESLKSGTQGYASAHYFICLNGDVLQCIPDNEMAYHVGATNYKPDALSKLSTYPNNCTLGIECTVIDWDGNMTKETYESMINFCAFKLKQFELTSDDLWLHYDITGKDCHKWFVNNPNEWIAFKEEVHRRMNGETKNEEDDEMNFENDWQWKMLGDALDGMYRKGLISDYSWAEKAYTRNLKQSELSWLNTIIFARQNEIDV